VVHKNVTFLCLQGSVETFFR